jgi:hypothetical protein
MTERKKWDRTKSSQMMFDKKYSDIYTNGASAGVGGASSNSSQEQPSDPIAEKQRQYIKMLEERNRLKKKLESNKSQKEKELQQREEQFITTFNGSYIVQAATNTTATISSNASTNGVPIRKNKSSSAMLPTKLTNYNPSRSNSGAVAEAKDGGENNSMVSRESGATTAPTRESGGERPRQKWSRPQGQFGTESKRGKTLLFVKEDKKRTSDSEIEEEEEAEAYLKESFEEFEEEEEEEQLPVVEDSIELEPQDAKASSIDMSMSLEEEEEDIEKDDTRLFTRTRTPIKVQMQVSSSSQKTPANNPTPLAVIDTSTKETSRSTEESGENDSLDLGEEEDDLTRTSSSLRSSNAHSPQQQQEIMSRTTTELFGIIQNLSRTKQKALMDVLQAFHQSQKRYVCIILLS